MMFVEASEHSFMSASLRSHCSAVGLTRAYSNTDNEAHSKRFHPCTRRG